MRLMPLASAVLGASLVCGILPAQSTGKSEAGKPESKVEFIGLESWSPEKLAAAVKDKCKGHYCAATLKQDLGFADAAVMIHAGAEPRTVVAVVEPQFAARVRYKPAPEGAVFVPRGWQDGITLVEKKPMAFQAAILQHALVLAEGAEAGAAALEGNWSAADISGAREVWAFFKERSAAADCAQAVWCVDRAASAPVRQLAAAVLMNFHREDVAWWALADGLRDSDDRVKMTCEQALFAMGKRLARPVDWRPAVPALRAVLDGTNLFAFGALAKVLDATSVVPDLAQDLLAGAGHALLAHSSAKGEDVRKGAVALLERLSGKRLAGPQEWAEWVGKLETREPAPRR
jgi:hypothetical protein